MNHERTRAALRKLPRPVVKLLLARAARRLADCGTFEHRARAPPGQGELLHVPVAGRRAARPRSK